MLIATGARIGEILALRWSDVDFAGRTVTIEATVVRIAGKGVVIQEHPKSESSNRRLKLPLFAMDLLTRRRIDAYSELVFPSSTGTPRWPENIRTQWANAVRGTDLEWMTTRSCRKGVAAYLEAAVDIEAAKEQLGHSSSSHHRQVLCAGEDRPPRQLRSSGSARRVGAEDSMWRHPPKNGD